MSDAAKEAIQRIDSSLTDVGLEYYLWGGALLGLYRDGGFIPHDNDLDFVVPYQSRGQLVLLRKVLESAGFTDGVVFEDPQREGVKFEFFLGDLQIELNVLYPLAPHRRWYALYELMDERTFNVITFWDHVVVPTRRTLAGVTCMVPSDIEAHLAFHYGETWRSPKRDYHYVHNAPNLLYQYQMKSTRTFTKRVD